jgi:hypothetical protein
MFFILLVSSISVVSQFFKHFTKVEKVTIRWIALFGLRTTGPSTAIIVPVLITFSSQKLKYDAFLQISYRVSQPSIVV